jgi:hypothetical protein
VPADSRPCKCDGATAECQAFGAAAEKQFLAAVPSVGQLAGPEINVTMTAHGDVVVTDQVMIVLAPAWRSVMTTQRDDVSDIPLCVDRSHDALAWLWAVGKLALL